LKAYVGYTITLIAT